MMVAAVALLFFIYYPIVSIYLFPEGVELTEKVSDDFRIVIPKIYAEATVIENVDPWNQDEYLEALQNGVAHASGSALPGDAGTTYLFAHSSDVPWRITKYNTAFYRLGELDPGDEIYVEREGRRYRYIVKEKLEVWPNEVEYLKEDQGDVLILQTCAPPGTALKRLLIFASPVLE